MNLFYVKLTAQTIFLAMSIYLNHHLKHFATAIEFATVYQVQKLIDVILQSCNSIAIKDVVHSEGGLSLHLDRNPLDPYLLLSGGLEKWRPIQGFVCLTGELEFDLAHLYFLSTKSLSSYHFQRSFR
jgi:hypothetical protein